MIYVKIYLFLALLWGKYSTYKQYQYAKKLSKLLINLAIGFGVNFLCFPYCFYYAIKNNKFN